MRTTWFEAPGKVLLFGEYAVLHGARAVVVAVDRAARCAWLGDAPGEAHRVVVEGLGFGRIVVDPGAAADPQLGGELPFARALIARTPLPRLGLYRIDTAAFRSADPAAPGKLGLGSSAAATVALAAALNPRANPAELFARAHAAHRAVQGGGSGADVAASAFGGALGYRWFGDAALAEAPAAAETAVDVAGGRALVAPLPGLVGRTLHFAWSGVSASTTALMAPVRALAQAQPAVHRAHMAALAAAAVQGEAALLGNDGEALVAAADAGRAVLAALGTAAGAPLITPELEALQAALGPLGGVGKPTGAGGGDLVWLVGRDAEHEARLAVAARAASFGVLALTVARPRGG